MVLKGGNILKEVKKEEEVKPTKDQCELWHIQIKDYFYNKGLAKKGLNFAEFKQTCLAGVNWQLRMGYKAEEINPVGMIPKVKKKDNIKTIITHWNDQFDLADQI